MKPKCDRGDDIPLSCIAIVGYTTGPFPLPPVNAAFPLYEKKRRSAPVLLSKPP
ncbi:hypothetical protein PUNSTDRAFT_55008 [Punctularia strigosozonata HHB-11173 SS5]|uniref:Uncharacterized protein n=1 Tax=Punctularia strigosozonata (strain HHB-11173) TaxID=741275 RepID=R7S570_PUNST|nr:uncharacterized protein PUNSTDRAFT_55008 [Punctularia strigosozonata HHB-11173 SS5]EIN05079.1 hypothetical protein PUNSTDRAFT_55008 [Punctularia strigosozonata HHB-11173 SS5]